eukprot:516999-Rhodomonas_salina.1
MEGNARHDNGHLLRALRAGRCPSLSSRPHCQALPLGMPTAGMSSFRLAGPRVLFLPLRPGMNRMGHLSANPENGGSNSLQRHTDAMIPAPPNSNEGDDQVRDRQS